MSKYQQLITTSLDVVIARIKECGSIIGTVRSFGFPRGDERARKYIASIVVANGLEDDVRRYLSKRTEYSVDDVRCAVANSLCFADVLRMIGLTDHGGNRNTVKRIIEANSIPTDHFRVSETNRRNKMQYAFDEIFCTNSKYPRSSLSKAAKRFNVLEYRCVRCGNVGEWLGETLPLVLDHINGINNDNRVDNLRYLCYNCHALTETFAGKNVRGVGKSG